MNDDVRADLRFVPAVGSWTTQDELLAELSKVGSQIQSQFLQELQSEFGAGASWLPELLAATETDLMKVMADYWLKRVNMAGLGLLTLEPISRSETHLTRVLKALSELRRLLHDHDTDPDKNHCWQLFLGLSSKFGVDEASFVTNQMQLFSYSWEMQLKQCEEYLRTLPHEPEYISKMGLVNGIATVWETRLDVSRKGYRISDSENSRFFRVVVAAFRTLHMKPPPVRSLVETVIAERKELTVNDARTPEDIFLNGEALAKVMTVAVSPNYAPPVVYFRERLRACPPQWLAYFTDDQGASSPAEFVFPSMSTANEIFSAVEQAIRLGYLSVCAQPSCAEQKMGPDGPLCSKCGDAFNVWRNRILADYRRQGLI